jgi:hypothetical protein
MQQVDISRQVEPDDAAARFHDSKSAHSNINATGTVYFDVEPKFPCFALFLEKSHCLLLEQTNNEFHRFLPSLIVKILSSREDLLTRVVNNI